MIIGKILLEKYTNVQHSALIQSTLNPSNHIAFVKIDNGAVKHFGSSWWIRLNLYV